MNARIVERGVKIVKIMMAILVAVNVPVTCIYDHMSGQPDISI